MDFLHNDREIFSQAVNLVSSKKGIRSEIVEKDYYVTVILKFLSERLPFIVFKGGTSLSKCHGAIKRFSEDIDITIDTSLSQGQKKKVKDAIVEVCEILGLEIPNLDETRSRRDYNRYEIAYNPLQKQKILPFHRKSSLKHRTLPYLFRPSFCLSEVTSAI